MYAIVFFIFVKLFQLVALAAFFALTHIILAENFLVSVFVGMMVEFILEWHTVYIILLVAGLTIGLTLLHRTTVGFWIMSGIYTLFWGWVAWSGMTESTDDKIWIWFVTILVAAGVTALHFLARGNMGIDLGGLMRRKQNIAEEGLFVAVEEEAWD